MEKKILEKKAKWFNLSDTVEAIRKAVLELKEAGTEGPKGEPFKYEDFTSEQLEALQGEQGIQGEQGLQGEQGPPGKDGVDGTDGADGFGTEAQWNELVQRVTTLEENSSAE